MKLSLVVLVGFFSCVLTSSIPQHHESRIVKDKQLLERQQKIVLLYDRVFQHSVRPEHVEMAKTFNMEEHVDDYTRPHVVQEFMNMYKHNPIKRGEIFSVFNEVQMRQAIALVKILYFAKDFETFYKTAVWARNHVNQPMFVYSLTVAVLHRQDTQHIMLPPIHEVMPYYFFPTEVIHMAQYYKQTHDVEKMDKNVKDFQGYTIDANYSGSYLNLHREQSLSYLMEDIGLNSMNFYYHVQNPSWMSTEEYGLKHKNRGAFHMFKAQQITARYYLERLANKQGEIPMLDWDVPLETPYTPSLVYPNGLEFPDRPKFANLHEHFYTYGQKSTNNKYSHSFNYIKDAERRIVDAIDSRRVLTKEGKIIKLDTETMEGLNILGNLISGNIESVNPDFYIGMNSYLRVLLGYSMQPLNEHKLVPSALEHLTTTYRDPVAYQMLKKLLSYTMRYLNHVPSYNKKDLVLPGVEITDVEVDELVTYMDHFYSDLSNAVFYGPHETKDTFRVRVRQQRMNHKPWEFKLRVKSDKDQKVAVKVFLGPKYDEYERYMNMTENNMNFVELDHFVQELKSGENVVERNSHQFSLAKPDSMTGRKLYHQVQMAMEQNEGMEVDQRQNSYKWPQRMMLPKGSKEGTVYQLFFFMYPLNNQPMVNEDMQLIFAQVKPYGYPLERNIKYDGVLDVPNAQFHEVKIYYKDVYELNVPQKQQEH